MTGQDWVLLALIAATAEYRTVQLCLKHRAAQRAADRAAKAKEQAKS